GHLPLQIAAAVSPCLRSLLAQREGAETGQLTLSRTSHAAGNSFQKSFDQILLSGLASSSCARRVRRLQPRSIASQRNMSPPAIRVTRHRPLQWDREKPY